MLPACAFVMATTATPSLAESMKVVTMEKGAKDTEKEGVKANLTVVLKGVQAKDGPLYIAVQKRENYQKWQAGAGGVYQNIKAGQHTYEYQLPAGDYAVSVWHDSDNDGKFTMQGYLPLDGWGNSGNQNLQAPPSFDDVKITLSAKGKSETINMHYPQDK
jgi:uncharacterized protein (DUF2141 family)